MQVLIEDCGELDECGHVISQGELSRLLQERRELFRVWRPICESGVSAHACQTQQDGRGICEDTDDCVDGCRSER